MMVNGKNFPEAMYQSVRTALESADESKEGLLLATQWKNPTIGFVLAFFLGCLGVDRFWLGQTGLGVLKLITCGGCDIWWLIDLFTIFGRTKDANYKKLMALV